jgi:AcrR family transcriptional regulator
LRVRTEARRRAIIEAGREVFQKLGFERTTMSEISKRLGGSKATLYSYFPSKEDLFVACVQAGIDEESGEIVEATRAISDTREALLYFAAAFLAKATSDRPIALMRLIANQPPGSGVGLNFYEHGLKQGWLKFCLYLEDLMAAGELRQGTAWVMAMHLKGMVEAEYVERRILNALPHELDRQTIQRISRDAVDAFLRAYGPE